MNRICFLTIFVATLFYSMNVYSQDESFFSPVNIKEITKEAKKKEKSLEKEGWNSLDHKKSIYDQVYDVEYFKLMNKLKNDNAVFVHEETAKDKDKDQARKAAELRAKAAVVSLISRKVVAEDKRLSEVDNTQTNDNLIHIGSGISKEEIDVQTLLSLYRKSNEEYEVLITIAARPKTER